MENKMAEVAKLLGVELDEEFRIEHLSAKYKLSKGGLEYWSGSPKKWNGSELLEDLIIGKLTLIKIQKPILNEKEKEYLSQVIKPFKAQVIAIAKRSLNFGEYIDIMIDEGELCNPSDIYLPYFKPNSMYKGMTVNREYTLDQLDL